MTTKVCNWCSLPKPTHDFDKDIESLDGLYAYCTDCSKLIIKEYDTFTPLNKDEDLKSGAFKNNKIRLLTEEDIKDDEALNQLLPLKKRK